MMNEMRKLMETLEQINEAPPRKKVRLRAKPKQVKKKVRKTVQRRGSKVWMYGDEELEKVSGPIPVSFILAYIEAVSIDDYDKQTDLIDTLADNTSGQFARVFDYSFHDHDVPDMKKVLAGGSEGFGETEYIAGFGPTKAKAKAAYDEYTQDATEVSDEGDWDY